MTTLKLGDRARDTVSGWEGTATGRFEYMNGCVRWSIAASDKDGKPEEFVFDEQQIEVVTEASDQQVTSSPSTGGPRSNRPIPRGNS